MDAQSGEESVKLDVIAARRWFLLAVGSLLVAGLLALTLVIGRTPGLDRLVSDPLLFKRALVVHVDLSLVVWFYAFIAALFTLIPARPPRPRVITLPPLLGVVGVVLLVVAAALPSAKPVLSNYVPVLDHPLFAAGLLTFGCALVLAIAGPRLLPSSEEPSGLRLFPSASIVGLRAAALCLLIAVQVFVATALATPDFLPTESRYEIVFWGGGHVLQLASEAAMVAVWIALLAPLLGRSPLSRAQANVVFGGLLLAALVAPLLCFYDPTSDAYRSGFTRLMRWGVFPFVLLALGLIVRSILRARANGSLPHHFFKDRRFLAFAASVFLTLLGFVLGALIRGSNTMVPAHYHASIGAVTASFFGAAFILYKPLGLAAPRGRLFRLTRYQPLVYGIGQSLFAIGFGLAGAHGMARKAYGAEQVRRTFVESLGLGVMGLGGLVAVAAGILFLAITLSALRPVVVQPEPALLRSSWKLPPPPKNHS